VSDTLDEMKRQAAVVQRRLDRLNGFLWFAGTLDDSRSLGKLLAVMQQEGEEMNRESERLQALLSDIRKQRETKERNATVRQLAMMILLSLMALLLIAGMPVLAQESTPEAVVITLDATPLPVEATPEPTPPVVVVQPDPSDKTLYVVGFLIFAFFVGLQQFLQNRQIGALTGTLGKVLENKQVIEEGQRLYMESSLSVQNFVTLVQGIAFYLGSTIPGEDPVEKVGEFLNKVTTPPPNADPQPGQVG